jgi:nitrate/nitrite transporter NarK
MALLVVPLAGFFRGTDPVAAPVKTSAALHDPALEHDHDWTVKDAVRTRHFWLLFAVYLCTGLGSFLVSLHQLAFAVDVGFDKLYAATVLGVGSFLAIAGTIFTGTISDYIGRERSAILAYGISIVGWCARSSSPAPSSAGCSGSTRASSASPGARGDRPSPPRPRIFSPAATSEPSWA